MMNRTDDNENTQAAFFDLDGLIYHEDVPWKIVNPYIGVIGSSIHYKKACALFESILKDDPGALITDHFIIDDYDPPFVPPAPGLNIMPLDSLFQTATSHRSRNRDLYVITSRFYPGMESVIERIYERFQRLYPAKFRFVTNPFPEAGRLTPTPRTSNLTEPDGMELKLELLISTLHFKTLSKREQKAKFAHVNPDGILYDKIFYYYSEETLRPWFEELIRSGMDRFVDGRNALVPFYISGEKGNYQG